MGADWTLSDLGDLTGRTVLVTGGPAGVGLATVEALADAGATVVAAGRRNPPHLPDGVRWIHLDLADPKSPAALAAAIAGPLDVLINNAGINIGEARLNDFGQEQHMLVNHLGHFVLTALLLPQLERGRDPRVVSVTSEAHRRADLDPATLSGDPAMAYENSKLAMLLFAFELQRRLRSAGSPVLSLACHPGFIATEMVDSLANSLPPGAAETLRAAVHEHAWPPKFGCVTPCYCAFGPASEEVTYVEPALVNGVPVPWVVEPSAAAVSETAATAAWEASERLSGTTLRVQVSPA